MKRAPLASAVMFAAFFAGNSALAADPPAPGAEPTEEQIETAIKNDAQRNDKGAAGPEAPVAAPEEAPPPPPRHKGLVLESELGALGFFGQMRHLSPTGPWLHMQLGWEFFRWLMVFGEGELAFTDTSNGVDDSQVRAFPIFGFGGGARATIHVTERVAFWLQGSIGAMKADIANRALAIVGFGGAESLGLSLGGRLGVEWYQLDRHLAFGASFGMRDASGFAKKVGPSDTGLLWDSGLVLRYTF